MIYKSTKPESRLLFFALAVALIGTVLFSSFYKESVAASVEVIEIESDAKMPAVPIIMYHSVCDNKRVNSDYRISGDLFESDMKYLQKNGYTAIFVGDLVGYVYEGMPLPEKPVIITLDDGYLNNFTEVLHAM